MRVLCIDPGAHPGFCLTEAGVIVWYGAECERGLPGRLDELVIEDQHSAAHLYRNGRRVRIARKSQMTLAHTAGRLLERFDATRKYRIAPDAWRAVLWPGSRRLPKKTVLARLTPDYGHLVAKLSTKKAREDVLEAIGIAAAWGKLTQEQKETYRVQ
jgi:hypothetical protein